MMLMISHTQTYNTSPIHCAAWWSGAPKVLPTHKLGPIKDLSKISCYTIQKQCPLPPSSHNDAPKHLTAWQRFPCIGIMPSLLYGSQLNVWTEKHSCTSSEIDVLSLWRSGCSHMQVTVCPCNLQVWNMHVWTNFQSFAFLILPVLNYPFFPAAIADSVGIQSGNLMLFLTIHPIWIALSTLWKTCLIC